MSPTVTTTGYGSRIGNSFKAIIGGFVLLIGSIVLLSWNENNFVKQKAALEETESQTIETTADSVNPELDGKVVYVSGKSSTTDEYPLIDPVFGVQTDDLKLIRHVEMYQWEEEERTSTEDNLGGSSTTTKEYTYHKKWSDTAIDSSNFYEQAGHENPGWIYDKEEYAKSPILLGAYTLTETFVNKLTDQKLLSLANQEIKWVDGMTGTDAILYIGENMSQPEIGDVKITFYTVKPGDVSLVGEQYGDQLRAHVTSNGRSIALLSQSSVSASTLFEEAYSANSFFTWLIRGLGLLLLFTAFSMIFEIITTLAKVVPFIASIVGGAVGIVCFCLALIVWIITIAIAWLAVRPIYGVIALVAVLAIIVGMISLKKRNKESIVEKGGVVSVREEEKDDNKKDKDDNKKDKDDVEIIEA